MSEGKDFFEAAGRSLGEAQGALTATTPDVPTGMAISEASLEVRVVVARSAGGLDIQPVGAELARKGALDPGLVSTVNVRYVPVASAAAPARRLPERVIDDVRARPDVQRLQDIVGDLRFEAQYLPANRRWLVTVQDADARTVREVVLPDDA